MFDQIWYLFVFVFRFKMTDNRKERMTAFDALQHGYFMSEREKQKEPIQLSLTKVNIPKGIDNMNMPTLAETITEQIKKYAMQYEQQQTASQESQQPKND